MTNNQKDALGDFTRMISNQVQSRFDLMDSLFGTFREYKMDHECGYPIDITPQLYKQFYLREGIAARVVGIGPDEAWKKKPKIIDTDDAKVDSDFEIAWRNLEKKMSLCSYLHRIDELSGIGRFGILLLGIDDGRDLDEPVEGIDDWGRGVGTKSPKRNLLYLRPFDESLVLINQFEVNPSSPRYGKPLYYSVNFIDSTQWGTVSPIGAETLTMRRIHWSRVIHVAENTSSSEIFGLPRMQNVFNRLYDLKKICGGSAEMFWKGGYPGLSLEVNPELQDVELDKDGLDREMQAYLSGLKRYLALTGISAKSLAPQISDPTAHFNLQLQAISISIKCPLRVFTGTEQGVLAGSQDATAWAQRVEFRRENHIDPRIINQTVDRLIGAQILPQVDDPEDFNYKTEWKELTAPDEQTQSAIILTKTQALAAYVGGQVDNLIPPTEYFVNIFGMTEAEAEEIVDSAGKFLGVSLDDKAAQQMDMQLNPPAPTIVTPNGAPAGGKSNFMAKPGTPNGFSKPSPFTKNQEKDLITLNDVSRKAVSERMCGVIETLSRMDLGENWKPEFLNSRAAVLSRDAITENVDAVETDSLDRGTAISLRKMHANAAVELAAIGCKTASKWHEGRANDLEKKFAANGTKKKKLSKSK